MNDSIVVPDLEWYAAQRPRPELPLRCPFASVHRCPRYYQSLSLLTEAGSTAIPPSKDRKLLRKWRKSDLWPVTREQYVSIVSVDGSARTLANFCPEVAFDRFGYFGHYLNRYSDELDRELAHDHLAGRSLPGDWRWNWSTVLPMHYSQCPTYAPLQDVRGKVAEDDNPRARDLIAIKPGFFGITLDLRLAWRRVRTFLHKIGW